MRRLPFKKSINVYKKIQEIGKREASGRFGRQCRTRRRKRRYLVIYTIIALASLHGSHIGQLQKETNATQN
jgi:hypothetical protein